MGVMVGERHREGEKERERRSSSVRGTYRQVPG